MVVVADHEIDQPEPAAPLANRLRELHEDGLIEALFVGALIAISFVNAVVTLLR